jgi:hypothetical protein
MFGECLSPKCDHKNAVIYNFLDYNELIPIVDGKKETSYKKRNKNK